MEWQKIWVLRGANIWARCPLLEVELDVESLSATPPERVGGFTERLHSWLPTACHPRPGGSGPGGLTEEPGLVLAQALQRVTLELQRLAESHVHTGLVRPVRPGAFYRVLIEFEEEALGLACVESGRQLCLAALRGEPFDLQAEVARLRDLAHDVRLGPSTGAIVRAARRRGIPVRRLNSDSLVQLGQGVRQRRICTAETDRTSAVAEAVAQDKQLTRALLQAVGVPVPEGRPVTDAEDAWETAQSIGGPVVVKPQYGNHGRGVTTNLETRDEVVRAYAAAREEGESVVVERFIPGADYRLLVVGNQLVAAALREPAHVVGDGRSTVSQLVAEVNRDPRRSDGHATVLSFIKLDSIALGTLADQGFTPDSVPPAGHRVLIRRNANLSTGGTATDVTDQVHPEVAARAVEAARAVGLDIAGIDVVAPGLNAPLDAKRAAVVEINAGPGLRMHLEPTSGSPRPVGEAIVNLLYPEGQNGRIPLVAVTGVNGKTTTTRLIAHLLRRPGEVVGMACTDGLYLDNRRIDTRDCSGPKSARTLQQNPKVCRAVLETARGGILREGLGFDVCDVAVVTNIGGGDHLSMRGVETVEDLARLKRIVVEAVAPSGTAVLNAADPLVQAMAEHCPGSVIYFARDPENPFVVAHRAARKRAVVVRGGAVVLAEGDREEVLMPLDHVPMTHGGRVPFQVDNVLAAAAACWALAWPLDLIRSGLQSFSGDGRQLPGRFNVLQNGDRTVIVDYAHNASALSALVESLDGFAHLRRTLVFCGFHRRDVDLLEMGAIIEQAFDRLILHPDFDNPNRSDGELNALLRRGFVGGRRLAETVELEGEQPAIEMALADLRPGDLVVIGVEMIEEALSFTEAFLARKMTNGRVGST